MRRTSHVMARSWIALSIAVLAVLPAGAAVAATPQATPTAPPAELPFVGGYVAGKARVEAKAPAAGRAYASTILPDAVDLRQYAPAPGNQGQVGSCAAWTIAYGLMGYYANRTGGVGAPYAPLFLYMRNVVPGGAPSAGLYPDSVLANATSAGVDTQASYYQGTTNYQVPPTQAQITNALNYRVSGWKRLFNGSNQGTNAQTVIKQALASDSPVAIGFDVYPDFHTLRTHTSAYNTLSGTSRGGHMVAAFGYDAQGLIIRNSWGTGWGNGGDAKLSWAFVNKVVSAAYTVSGITTPAAPIALPPTVAALSTQSASAGTAVTITGAGLAAATSVKFGGDAAAFSPVTEGGVTKLVATAPAHALGAVDVTVTNPTGTSAVSAAARFTYIPKAPAISALTPNAASIAGGTTVTVTGSDLAAVTTVKIGTTSAPATAVTDSSLTFVAPARAAGPADVTVTTVGGTSPVTVASRLTFVTPPAPQITALEPSSGLTTKATPVVVTGTDLAGVTKVTAGDVSVPFTKVSGTQLKVTLPVRAAGAVALRITGPGGVSTASAGAVFTYRTPPAPVVSEISPASGSAVVKTPIVITGANLADASKVTVDGATVSFTKVSATTLKLTLPLHAAGDVVIRVTTPAGVSAGGSDATFTYRAPVAPTITELSPSSGSTLVVNTVMLAGTDLTGVTKVTAGGTNIKFARVSDTQLKLTVPKLAAGGDLDVVLTAAAGTSEAGVWTAVAPPAPRITALSADTGLTSTVTPVTVTGTELGGVTKVTLAGKRVSFKKVSETSLTFTAPKRAAGAVDLVVIGPGGPSDPASFTYVPPPLPAVSALSVDTGYTDRTTKITITGSDLTGATKVTAAGRNVAYTRISDTQITVTMPKSAAGAVPVVVTTAGGSSDPVLFTYTPPV